MNWTEPKPPTRGESYYDHIKCITPIGVLNIEWKSWKEDPNYFVDLDGITYITTQHSLEDAKLAAENYIIKKRDELINFLNED